MEHKKQHWVPQSYLAAWCDPEMPADHEPFVWMFPKQGGPGRRKAPRNIFYETDMYTVRAPDSARDLSLERGLSSLEGMFVKVRREKLEPRVELDAQDRLVISAFVAAAVGRTRKQREHMQSQWAGVLEDMETIREAMRGKSPKERSDLAQLMSSGGSRTSSLGYPEVKRLAEAPLQNTLRVTIATQVPLLFEMNLGILSTENIPGFITSDAPCVWFDPDASRRPPLLQAPGLMWPSIEVTLPVSPRQLVVFHRAGWEGYYGIPEPILDELNRRTRAHAGESFVVSRDATRSIWYEMEMPPTAEPDADPLEEPL